MRITTTRVKQYSSKPVTVVCADGQPICTVRGMRSLSDIMSYIQGYDVTLKDGKIERELTDIRKRYADESAHVERK